jgi:hypothetical protein
LTHSSSELIAHADAAQAAAVEPGWAMAPLGAADSGFTARGSWLLEPDTGTGMLLYPLDWSFVERRDVTAHLRADGWSVVPINRFLHLASDGITAIRLLARTETASVSSVTAEIVALRWPAAADADVLEASV